MTTPDTRGLSEFTPVRVGFVGVGSMAETIHLPSVARHPNCEITALIDPHAAESRLQHLSEIFGCPWFRSPDEAEMDLAFLSTPISKHVEAALPLVHRGIHAFVEKPLASNVAAAEQLLEAAKVSNCRVFCGHVRRYNANIKLVHSLLESALFGRIEGISLYFGALYGWHRQYFSEADDDAKSIDEGVLYDIGAHGLDSVLTAVGRSLSEISFEKAVVDDLAVCNDIELTGSARCRDSNNPVRIYAALSNTMNLANVIWIKTESGTLALSLSDPNSLILFPQDGGTGINLTSARHATTSPFSEQLEAIIGALNNTEKTDVDGQTAVATVSLLQSAHEIAEQGTCTWLAA